MEWKMFVYLMAFGTFYDYLTYFVAIWYIFPVLVRCEKKNLATLYDSRRKNPRSLLPFETADLNTWPSSHSLDAFIEINTRKLH
jgi:hypothetical protein